jgi:hypothetical protein
MDEMLGIQAFSTETPRQRLRTQLNRIALVTHLKLLRQETLGNLAKSAVHPDTDE